MTDLFRPPPKSLEYSPAEDAPPWLIEDWQGLSAAFDLRDHEVIPWHLALAGQGRPWLVIRRLYKLAPLWGDGASPDDLKAWSWSDLSATLGVPESHLKSDLKAAKEFWKKARRSASLTSQISKLKSPVESAADSSPDPRSTISDPLSTPSEDPVKPLDSLPQFSIHQALDEEHIAAILTPFRFQSIRSASDRLYVANRILELRQLLEDKNTRESARTLIVMELNMASHESTLNAHRFRLESIQKGSEISKEQSAEIQKIGDAITATEKALTVLSTTYRAAAAELGSDEAEAGELRRVAIGTISHLTEAHRLYYASGDKTLIDGMFTGEELVWLTTPLTIRPAQYRPDVVLRMREACIPENLWGKDYQPTVVQREACRRLLKLTQLLTEETEPPAISGIDDATTPDEEADDLSSASQAIAEPAPDSPGILLQDYVIPAQRPDEPCMVVG